MEIRFVGLWIVSFALLAQGCAAPPQAYPGPRRSPDQVAILESDAKSRILGVDGREYFDRVLEVLPGERAITFKYQVEAVELYPGMLKRPTDRAVFMCELQLVVEAGHSYRIKREKPQIVRQRKQGNTLSSYHNAFGVAVVDLETGQTLAEMYGDEQPGPGVCPWERNYRRK